ncbi:hypothetical protein BDN72DRAFT_904343 [Pluteus cervinus]|uniref:Uncharacterized protein n=1 Tax=Pluteus cervinus TaxID=181527 RepID=A0ACD3A604_9AGAR|nr:hypothetical protein BDN72DRAFT_904343 [Pluteus cervinus]
MSTVKKKVSVVAASIIKKPPFCTGVVEIDEQSSTLFYKAEGKSASFLSLVSADVDDLRALAGACPPAKLGRGNQDVYDSA